MASDDKSSLLIGVDFSEGSERALARAVRLAQRLNAHLHVVHVYEPLAVVAPEAVLMTGEIQGQLEAERSQRRKEGEALCERTIGDKVAYTFRVVDGLALDGMLSAIHELKPELVVVGSHGRGALMRMLMGSVSTALCRRCPVPVVVVPTAEQEAAS